MTEEAPTRETVARDIARLQRRLSIAIGAAAADAIVDLSGLDASVAYICRAAETLPDDDRPAVADGLDRLQAALAWLGRSTGAGARTL